jgi:hypothetical protein
VLCVRLHTSFLIWEPSERYCQHFRELIWCHIGADIMCGDSNLDERYKAAATRILTHMMVCFFGNATSTPTSRVQLMLRRVVVPRLCQTSLFSLYHLYGVLYLGRAIYPLMCLGSYQSLACSRRLFECLLDGV